MVGVSIPPPLELTESTQGNAIPVGASWGDQLDAADPLSDPDDHVPDNMFMGKVDVDDCDSEIGDESVSRGSDDDEQGTGLFFLSPAAKRALGDSTRSGSPNPTDSADLHVV
ncbi:hypothetical protein JOB18_038375 [Solea senegalensis]|uniref:Uncharacterized protein n=1 Tax=Solea senegalensis TaxID=28829 RepID=A0AAV6Q755_SOLSE|nr:hypothetical protein JOB18_038375 [Solea senegalensis]